MASRGTGVVVGSHSVRAVEVRKKGGVTQLTRVVSRRVDPADGDALDAGAVAANLSAEKLRPGPVFLGLSGKDLVMRYTQVPPVPDWKLETLMRYEIDEVSQQSGGDVSADYAVLDLPLEASADTSVLVAMVKNSLLVPRVKMLESLRMKVQAAVPNSLVLFNAFLWYGDVKANETTLLVRLGGRNIDVAIQKDGNLLFARNVSGGGEQFTDAIAASFSVPKSRAEKMKIQKGNVTPKSQAQYAEPAEEKIANAIMGVAGQVLSAIQSSIMFARAQTRLPDLSVERVVIAGGGANLRGLREYLETNLGLPVTRFDPLPALDLSALAEGERQLAESDPAGLAVAIGLATMALEGGGAFWVEILPEAVRKRREFVQGPLFSLLAAAVVAIFVVLLFWNEGKTQSALGQSRRQHEAKLATAKRGVREAARLKADLQQEEIALMQIREIGALNGVLAKAGVAVQKHMVDEITLSTVKSVWVDRPLEVEVKRGRGGRTETVEIQRRVPYVVFQGYIEGKSQGTVWSRFIEGVKSEPGILVEDKPLAGARIEFRVTFPDEPVAPDGEGEEEER
jgi:type IV pilus assembly protein PilM